LTHDVGREAFRKFKDFGIAMQHQDEMCNSGYLHGVIEAYFKNSDNLLSTMKTVCRGYKLGSFASWECLHGVGHGIMFYTENDLPLSIRSCEIYRDRFSLSACVNGVFMENFNTDQKIHPSKYLRADDPFYPCNDQKDDYKSDCYLNAPTYYLHLHKGSYGDALVWCGSADSRYISTCVEGVGSQAIKENINSPRIVERICMVEASQIRQWCIYGMVSLYINNFGSLDLARSLCNNLDWTDKQSCENVVKYRKGEF
jgi:hypothetical protein